MSPKNDKKKGKNKKKQQNIRSNPDPMVMTNGIQWSQVEENLIQNLTVIKNIDKPKKSFNDVENTVKNSVVIENAVEKSENGLDKHLIYAHRLDIVKNISNLLDVANVRFISILEKLLELHENMSAEKVLRLQVIDLLLNHLEASDTDEVRDLLKACQNSFVHVAFENYIVDSKALVSEGIPLGTGGFGYVTLGKLYKSDGSWISVAIKTPITAKYNKLCVEEAKLMLQFDHKNIVKMLAFQKNPPKIAMEYMDWGSLCDASLEHHFTDRDLLNALHDVASGMEYIADMNYIHRDLACKNIFVDSKKQCKVGDFGLCKYVGDSNGFYEQKKYHLAMYNTAPESKMFQIFSTKSDVWAMGVLIWEVYFTVQDTESLIGERNLFQEMIILDIFQATGRLPRPPRCPSTLFSYIMVELFHRDPQQRPSFTAIKKVISQLLKVKQQL